MDVFDEDSTCRSAGAGETINFFLQTYHSAGVKALFSQGKWCAIYVQKYELTIIRAGETETRDSVHTGW